MDFGEVLARLEAIVRELETSASRSDERVHEILEARARRFAQPPAAERASEREPLVAFDIAGRRYGVDPRYVRAIVAPCVPTPLPGAPGHVTGVIHHRGEVLAVYDLARWAAERLPPDRAPRAPVVVVDAGNATFGIRADAVPEIVDAAVEPAVPPSAPAGALPATVRATGRGALMVIDLDALSRDPRLEVDERGR